VVFPPGADAKSRIFYPTCGSSAITGNSDEALCSI